MGRNNIKSFENLLSSLIDHLTDTSVGDSDVALESIVLGTDQDDYDDTNYDTGELPKAIVEEPGLYIRLEDTKALDDLNILIKKDKANELISFSTTSVEGKKEKEGGTYEAIKFLKVEIKLLKGENFSANADAINKLANSSKNNYLYSTTTDKYTGIGRKTGKEVSFTSDKKDALNFSSTDRKEGKEVIDEIMRKWLNNSPEGRWKPEGKEAIERKKKIVDAKRKEVIEIFANFNCLPVDGFDGQVIVHSRAKSSPYIEIEGWDGREFSRYYFTFHESYEVYYRTELGRDLDSAHKQVVKSHDKQYEEPNP
jgi:hypothetical protein